MAMSANDMANKILAKIQAKNPNSFDAGELVLLEEYLTEICEGIIEEIIESAVVQVNSDIGSVIS